MAIYHYTRQYGREEELTASQVKISLHISDSLELVRNLDFPLLVFGDAGQYNTIQYDTIRYNTIQYNTIRYNTIQYDTVVAELFNL